MNAALLLVTAAWCTGADAPVMPLPPPPPSAAAVGDCGCGGGCGCETGCEKPGLFAKLRAKFASHEGCGCDSCDKPAPVHYHPAPTCGTPCNSCEAKHSWKLPKLEKCGCEAAPACGCEGSEGFFARFRGHWGKRGHEGCGCDSCDSCGAAPVGETIGTPVGTPTMTAPGAPLKMERAPESVAPPKTEKKLPEGSVAPVGLQTAPAVKEESKNPFELDRRYESRVDRAADYSWLTGQLFYVHADGGLWVLRYAPLSKEDPKGGGVVLARDRQMDSYREGDLVKIQGEILNDRASKNLGAPLYRASSIQLLERGE